MEGDSSVSVTTLFSSDASSRAAAASEEEAAFCFSGAAESVAGASWPFSSGFRFYLGAFLGEGAWAETVLGRLTVLLEKTRI